eukprot:gnl/TRDRNA2_/TRDRNA2_170404_c0_seq1.p1 gnl/TRDRNA2_/TRDRNA2_170404_c0~~gnl/TRDRNA2_/TRDRNA2_170404_c0_seq1.p1  ORF type:complete len:684 (-),score=133.09 gnl/TRDRNA2_/TRDRNA2_170404_c0_seq1:92-2143(-)
MRPVAVTGNRPASRARARSPTAPSTRSQAAAYGFQSPVSRGAHGSKESRGDGGGFSAGSQQGERRPRAPSGSIAQQDGGRSQSRHSRLSVVVRKRPMNRREIAAQQQDVVECRGSNSVIVREPKLKVDLTRYVEEHTFLFDQAFDENVSNEMIYASCVRPLIDAVFQKAKCTCFAYGQTGSGKTFTMMGPPKAMRENGMDKTPGIFLLAAKDIFRSINMPENGHLGIYIAFYEIYCGKLFDLLNNRQILHARENAKSNVVIVGLQEHLVENVNELMEVIEYGLNSRTVGVTGANVDSSRSHAILQICLKDVRNKEDGKLREHGKISFIDLAGSERGADTLDTDRQTRMDGAEINKSLLALKECIRALDQQLDHTPFRGSKLTQVLKDSFVGSYCRTVMIANVSPCGCAVEHSLNTLRYAYRVKELRRSGVVQSGSNSADMGQIDDGMQPMHGQLAIEEESSDDDGDSGGAETPPGVQQQMRVANLSAVAQTLQSPRVREETRRIIAQYPDSFDGRGDGMDMDEANHHPESIDNAGRGPVQAWSVATAPTAEVLPVPGPSGAREVAPETALEPVGCSQAALDELARQHDRLIGQILAEEEELITAHRQHIDNMVELIKEEMVHLNNVDRPGSDVDAYVAGLDRILRLKANYIEDIRRRVDQFKEHLQQEDALSRKFQSLAQSPT